MEILKAEAQRGEWVQGYWQSRSVLGLCVCYLSVRVAPKPLFRRIMLNHSGTKEDPSAHMHAGTLIAWNECQHQHSSHEKRKAVGSIVEQSHAE